MNGDTGAAVRAALGRVVDPEMGLDVVSLGLIYGIECTGDAVRIVHTLTTAGCPMESHITRGIPEAALSVEGVHEAETELVWEPPATWRRTPYSGSGPSSSPNPCTGCSGGGASSTGRSSSTRRTGASGSTARRSNSRSDG